MSSLGILVGVAAVPVVDFLAEPIQAVSLEAAMTGPDNIQHAVIQHILADRLAGLAGVEPAQRMPDRAVHEGVGALVDEGDAGAEVSVLAQIHASGAVEDMDHEAFGHGSIVQGFSRMSTAIRPPVSYRVSAECQPQSVHSWGCS